MIGRKREDRDLGLDPIEPRLHEDFMLKHRAKDEKEAREDYLGSMLGDGGLITSRTSNAYFYVTQSAGDYAKWEGRERNTKYMSYLDFLRASQFYLMRFSSTYPTWYKTKPSAKDIKSFPSGYYLCCKLQSRVSPALTAECKCWYRPITPEVRELRGFHSRQKNYKVLPDSVEDGFGLRTLARWIEQDGSTAWVNDKRQVLFHLHSQSFSKEENERLCSILRNQLGVKLYLARIDDRHWKLATERSDIIHTVWDIVEYYIHPAFWYKIKRPLTNGRYQVQVLKDVETQQSLQQIGTIRESLTRK